MTENFDELLNFDPLWEAEKVTGQSYKDDEQTANLGFAMHMLHSQRKKDELALRGDTYWGIPYLDAMDIFLGHGFVPVWVYAYTDDRGNARQAAALWSDGILLVADEYNGTLNTAKMEFNWRPAEGSDDFSPFFRLGISGGMQHRGEGFEDIDGDPWVGVADIHVVEGFVHKLEKLRASGELLKTWYITDNLLSVYFVDPTEESSSKGPWGEHINKIKETIRKRVAEFDEPARSAVQAGMAGRTWEND